MHKNGSMRVVTGVLGTLLVACIVAGVSAAWGRTTAAGESIDDHERLDGHPVIVERVSSLTEKVDGIAVEQERQGAVVDAILVTVNEIRRDGRQ